MPVARPTRPIILVVGPATNMARIHRSLALSVLLVFSFLIPLHLALAGCGPVGVGNCCTDTQSQNSPHGGDGDSSVNQCRQEPLA